MSNQASNSAQRKANPNDYGDISRTSSNDSRSSGGGRGRIYSEEDEEVRKAKAMAMAIKSNPSLSADAVRQLVGTTEQSQLIGQNKKEGTGMSSLLIPGRLASAFQNIESNTASLRFGASSSGAAAKQDPEPSGKRKNQFKSLTESMRITREKAKERLHIGGKDSEGATSVRAVPKEAVGSKKANDKTSSPKKESLKESPKASNSMKRVGSSPSLAPSSSKDDDKFAATRTKERLSAVLWKRRSGLGKLSATKAWERRRVILRRTTLEYYTTDAELKEEEEEEEEVEADTEQAQDINKKQSWLEQAAFNIEKAKANMNVGGFGSSDDPNGPRGVLDLVKERATVTAATGHSGAPTPFAISLKVKGETKWKFCFDSHSTQMEWLVALTDVVVSASVDHYNSQLLEVADPTHEPSMFQGHANPLPPPVEGAETDGHRLWMMEDYNLKSASSPSEEGDDEQYDGDDEGVARDLNLAGEPGSSVVEPLKDIEWGFTERDLVVAIGVVNAAMIFCRTQSTTVAGFWNTLAVANVVLWVVLLKQRRETIASVAKAASTGGVKQSRSVPVGGKEAVPKRKNKAKSKESEFMPKAGTTTVLIENATDEPKVNDHIFAGWRAPPGTELMVRSHGYLSTKVKINSPGQLYDCVQCDIFESPSRYPDMARRVKLPEVEFENDDGPKTWTAPDIFVVSVSLPTDPPKLRSSDDGGGYTVTMYYAMRQDTRDILRRITSDDYDPSTEEIVDKQKSKVNAVKLFDEWCRRAPNDPKFMSRFKVIPCAQNLKEIGVPGWIGKYNGKPVLIKRPGQTGFLYPHPELSCMEFDISFHPFPYLAKQGICYMKEHFFKKVVVIFGFVIEGRADDELPECVLGLMQLCYPNPAHAIQAKDVFAGKSPQSF